jgi:hypothetical protein
MVVLVVVLVAARPACAHHLLHRSCLSGAVPAQQTLPLHLLLPLLALLLLLLLLLLVLVLVLLLVPQLQESVVTPARPPQRRRRAR